MKGYYDIMALSTLQSRLPKLAGAPAAWPAHNCHLSSEDLAGGRHAEK